jgi:PTS system nitrogen regulatory IIA component
MELKDILSEGSVLVCTEPGSKDALLRKLAEHTSALIGEPADAIYQALAQREALGSTGLGNGIAVPHGKFAGLPRVVAVFVRLVHPVDFDAVDDMPVDIVMMLLAPQGAGADHLKALARVARLLRTENLVDCLRSTTDPHQLYGVLTASATASQAA